MIFAYIEINIKHIHSQCGLHGIPSYESHLKCTLVKKKEDLYGLLRILSDCLLVIFIGSVKFDR